jgi:superfamily II RNA helicase
METDADILLPSSYIAESTAELNEQKAKLAESQKKLAELRAHHESNLTAIAVAQKECAQQKGFTKAQVYHLQGEFQSRQHKSLSADISRSVLQRNTTAFNIYMR